MEINDIREIEIFHTLDKIKEVNEAILFHQKFEEPDYFSIRQWQRVKSDLQFQLREMLFALDALPASPRAEAEKPSIDRTPKERGMSPENMAKIREARIAKRAETISSASVTPTPDKGGSAADKTPKRSGMSPEHMAKIREAREAKRAATAINTKPKGQ